MKFTFILFALITICACKQTIDTNAEVENLMQTSREWSKSAAIDSIEKTLSYWADDAVVMAPGQQTIKGKDAIRGMVEGMSKIPGFKISWEPISGVVSSGGDIGYLIEKTQISFNDSLGNTHNESNKAVTIWKRQPDGSWKNVVDTWNANPTTNH